LARHVIRPHAGANPPRAKSKAKAAAKRQPSAKAKAVPKAKAVAKVKAAPKAKAKGRAKAAARQGAINFMAAAANVDPVAPALQQPAIADPAAAQPQIANPATAAVANAPAAAQAQPPPAAAASAFAVCRTLAGPTYLQQDAVPVFRCGFCVVETPLSKLKVSSKGSGRSALTRSFGAMMSSNQISTPVVFLLLTASAVLFLQSQEHCKQTGTSAWPARRSCRACTERQEARCSATALNTNLKSSSRKQHC
jgi:hypothetical protein